MENLSEQFGQFCIKNNLVVVTAESCTAGLVSGKIADTPGSSAWLDSGFTVYTARAKHVQLGVAYETIDKFDITSEEVAREMAAGALNKSGASLTLAVTGLAGPTGGTEDIPVGTVCMAWGLKNPEGDVTMYSEKKHFDGSRNEIRKAVVEHMLLRAMKLA